jgi:hypothetical protein
MLLIEPGSGDPNLLHFDPQFIARNGVKGVDGQAWIKRDGQPMVPLDRFFSYRFGDGGRLGSSKTTFGTTEAGVDTASVMYSYDGEGRLLQELHNDIHGFFALRTEYDGNGRPMHVTNVRMENLGSDRSHFVEGVHTVISDERYQYTAINDTIWRKTYLNDRGRPYQEETFTQDRLGYLRGIERHNLITQRRGRISFIYDENGRLAERIEQADLGSPATIAWNWTYDDVGDPIARDLSRNGVLVRHSEYLYAEGTLFLKAVITKDNDRGLIEIMRYETTQ